MDYTNKRFFSGQNLYKLLKKIVLTITGLALFIVMVSAGEQWVYHQLDQQNNYFSRRDYVGWDMEMSRSVNDSYDRTNKGLLVLLILPTLFFGGHALYKYLFPIEKDESES